MPAIGTAMEKDDFTSEEIATFQSLYVKYRDATPLALFILDSQGKLVDGLWRKINARLGRTEVP
jgi:hypothetical protein